MTTDEVAELRAALRRSIELRTLIDASLADNEAIDLVAAWEEVERLDHDIVRRIRKRTPE